MRKAFADGARARRADRLLGALPERAAAALGSAWQLLRERYYGDQRMGVVDEAFMSLEVPSNTPIPQRRP